MNIDQKLLGRLAALNTWVRAGQRAPHKPLYFLLCLGRIQSGRPRLAYFAEIQAKLKSALKLFGPTRKSHHAEYPFWHLAQDRDDICEVKSESPILCRPGSSNPSSTELIQKRAKGGLREPYFEALKDLEFASMATHRILDAHFPPILHGDVLDFFEIKLDDPHGNDHSETWLFKRRVLEAYSGTCCVTGLRSLYGFSHPGLETVHICWPQAGGNDLESNGLLLNSLHAKLFVLGMIGVSDDYEILLSPHLETNGLIDGFESGRRLILPKNHDYWPSKDGLSWHRTQVFKG
jgi:putative restriction endonuclease